LLQGMRTVFQAAGGPSRVDRGLDAQQNPAGKRRPRVDIFEVHAWTFHDVTCVDP
jgi:hypothetical protein